MFEQSFDVLTAGPAPRAGNKRARSAGAFAKSLPLLVWIATRSDAHAQNCIVGLVQLLAVNTLPKVVDEGMKRLLAARWGSRGEHSTSTMVQWTCEQVVELASPFVIVRGQDLKAFGLSFMLNSSAHDRLLSQIVVKHMCQPAEGQARSFLNHGRITPCINVPHTIAMYMLANARCTFPTPLQSVGSLGLKTPVFEPPGAPAVQADEPLALMDLHGDVQDAGVATTSLTHKPFERGAIQAEFRPEVILASLQLSQLMKPSADMKKVVLAACRMVLDTSALQGIQQQFDSNALRLPVYDTLRKWWVKFDCLAT